MHQAAGNLEKACSLLERACTTSPDDAGILCEAGLNSTRPHCIHFDIFSAHVQKMLKRFDGSLRIYQKVGESFPSCQGSPCTLRLCASSQTM
eukprot:755938-Hanusia_phi.AAC.3